MQEDLEHDKKHQFDSSWLKFSARLLPLTDESCLAPLTHIIEETFDTPLKLLAAKTHFAAFSADLSAVKIQLSTNSLLCFVKTARAESSDLFRLIVDSFHAERQSGYTVLVIVDGSQEALKSRFENYAARVLFLNKKQLRQILLSSSWVVALAEQLRIAELRLDILSPYSENGVCSPELFVGRESELERLFLHSRNSCHALVGCRRIGKTSLMLDIKRRCERAGEVTFYIDCQTCTSASEFYDELVRSTRRKDFENRRHWTLKEYLLRLANIEGKGQCINLFLDEMDAIVSDDQISNYDMFKELVAAANAPGKIPIRLWMAGFKELYWSIADKIGPLYNKMNSEEIGPLAQQDAVNLISIPITHLGIKFSDQDKQIQRITSETNNHPGFLQLYCRLLINVLSNNNDKVITDQHLIQVWQEPEFQDYVKDYFVMNTTSLEKLIVLSVLNKREFIQEEVFNALKEYADIELEYKPLYKELRDLRFGSIFRQEGDVFTFQYPILANVLGASSKYIRESNLAKGQACADRANEKNK